METGGEVWSVERSGGVVWLKSNASLSSRLVRGPE